MRTDFLSTFTSLQWLAILFALVHVHVYLELKEEALLRVLPLWLMVCKLIALYNYMYLILYNTFSSDSDSTTTIVSRVKGRKTDKSITPVINGVLTNHII